MHFDTIVKTYGNGPPPDPPPSITTWKYSKYFCHYNGIKSKSLRIVQKSFVDTKKVIVIFYLLGGRGQPTYGNFHMFGFFFFWKLPLPFWWLLHEWIIWNNFWLLIKQHIWILGESIVIEFIEFMTRVANASTINFREVDPLNIEGIWNGGGGWPICAI